ncbi:MAG: prolyl oligopeptidase family serine peptidase, partial [Gammaproteobacteria bacterium]|nr:prolyl oligopeptidase family serine peptidase [Gammaproteobacteria bacterium]
SALLAIAASDDFAAAASLYGVSDPQALRQVTHKFEADYLDWLLGSSDAELQARAPLELVAQMHTPVIFFQGGRDVVVVPEQTQVMVAALREQGVPVDYHLYPDEGHGFRQAQHLAEILELELGFYQRVFEQRSTHLS